MSLYSQLHKSHAAVGLVFKDTSRFDTRPTQQAVHINGEIAREIAEKLAPEFAKQLIALGCMGVTDTNHIGQDHVDALASDIVAAFGECFDQHFEDAEEDFERARRDHGCDPDAARQEAREVAA